MSEPAQKWKNNEAVLKQICLQKLFTALKMVYFCCFSLTEKSRFSVFPPLKFYNINNRWSLD